MACPALAVVVVFQFLTSVLSQQNQVQFRTVQIISRPKGYVRPLECEWHSHAYDVKTGKCYDTHHSNNAGPCGEQMIFEKMEAFPSYGRCVCEEQINTCDRPVGFYPSQLRCYSFFTQGPCNSNEWVVAGPNGTVKCEMNHCGDLIVPNSENVQDVEKQNPVFFFSHKGNCYSTETQAFCKQGEKARFLSKQREPSCVDSTKESGTCFWNAETADASGAPRVGCLRGYTLNKREQCIPIRSNAGRTNS